MILVMLQINQEKQLFLVINRKRARYYPFQLNENQELDKRKYDNDLDNLMRHCEILHYHCSHNPRYITELNNTSSNRNVS